MGQRRNLFGILGILTVCVAATGSVAETATVGDIVAFCRVHPDLDYPNRTFFGTNYKQGVNPNQVGATGATDWRCMDGQVLMCLNSADGGTCSKKDPNRKPSAMIRQICSDAPGSAFIATYASGYSSSTWRCDGPRPAIIHTVPLDKRGFMKAPWTPYVVRNGVVVAPHDDDFGGDPR